MARSLNSGMNWKKTVIGQVEVLDFLVKFFKIIRFAWDVLDVGSLPFMLSIHLAYERIFLSFPCYEMIIYEYM